VHVAAAAATSLAGLSRATAHRVVMPDPLAEPARYLAAVADYVTAKAIDVVIPVTEAAALALLADPGALEPARIPMPDLATFAAISDKAALRVRAADVGLAFPDQHVLCTPEDPLPDVGFPVVVKPARSVSEWAGERVKLSVSHAATRDELLARLHALPRAAYPVLLQRRIVGPGIGLFVLIWDDTLVATFAHERIREKPPSGGVSVLAESVIPDRSLVDQATRLLRAFGWRGVAMVECKVDERTGEPFLMEINGRFWGTTQLAIDAGVDFPALLVRCALGEPGRGPERYRVGLRERWWWGEVDHLLARLRRSTASLALPPGAPGRGRAVLDFLRSAISGAPDLVFRVRDPMPFLHESARWIAGR